MKIQRHPCYQRNWRTVNVTILLSVLLLYDRIRIISCFSTGSGGCNGGIAAVGGTHLTQSKVQNGSLASGKIVVAIDGSVLDVNQTFTFPSNKSLDITIEGSQLDFKGFLIRVQAPNGYDTTNVITPNDNLGQMAAVCTAPIVGITHVTAEQKPLVSGTLLFPTDVDDVDFDITVVFINDAATGSAYVYNRLRASFRQGSPASGAPQAAVTTTAPTAKIGTPSAPVAPTPKTPVSTPVAPTPKAPVSVPVAKPAPTPAGAPAVVSKTPVSTVPVSSASDVPSPSGNVVTRTPFAIQPIPPILLVPSPTISRSPSPSPSSILPPIFGKGKGKVPKKKGMMMSKGKGMMAKKKKKKGTMAPKKKKGKGMMMRKGKGRMSKDPVWLHPPPPLPPKDKNDDDSYDDDILTKIDLMFAPVGNETTTKDDYVSKFDIFHQ